MAENCRISRSKRSEAGVHLAQPHRTKIEPAAPLPLRRVRSRVGTRSPRRLFEWLFRSRDDGRIVIAQAPNLPLGIWFGLILLRWVWHPDGRPGTALSVTSSAVLAWWSVNEIVRGVNPFRRI